MTVADASVIVRTKDKERSIERCLRLLRDQTATTEIIVVDSGSTDRTLEVARELCDRVIELPPGEFAYGRALNLGAEAAGAPFHVAVSAHTFLERTDWIARAIAHYDDPRVAAVNGSFYSPDGTRQSGVYLQDAEASRQRRTWGFSNTAASWRAEVWERFRFDESMEASEDKEWSWRVLDAGWLIAYDPALWIPDTHRRQDGIRELYRRERKEAAALRSKGALEPSSPGRTLAEWWRAPAGVSPAQRWRRRASYTRVVALAGRHAGAR